MIKHPRNAFPLVTQYSASCYTANSANGNDFAAVQLGESDYLFLDDFASINVLDSIFSPSKLLNVPQ